MRHPLDPVRQYARRGGIEEAGEALEAARQKARPRWSIFDNIDRGDDSCSRPCCTKVVLSSLTRLGQ